MSGPDAASGPAARMVRSTVGKVVLRERAMRLVSDKSVTIRFHDRLRK